MEITEKKNSAISGNDSARDKKKRLFSVECSEVESRYKDYDGGIVTTRSRSISILKKIEPERFYSTSSIFF